MRRRATRAVRSVGILGKHKLKLKLRMLLARRAFQVPGMLDIVMNADLADDLRIAAVKCGGR